MIGSKTRHKQLENKKDFSKRRERSFLMRKIQTWGLQCGNYEKNVIERSHPRKIGSILNGVDDDFSTPFFVFTKYLRNAIK